MTDSERLVDVEVRMTFLERLIEELNCVVTEQAGRIGELERQLRELKTQAEGAALDRDSSKPPHY